jgi:hypothetical protein
MYAELGQAKNKYRFFLYAFPPAGMCIVAFALSSNYVPLCSHIVTGADSCVYTIYVW